MDGQTNTDVWTDKQTDVWTDKQTNRGTEQWTDEGNDEPADGQTNGQQSTQLKGLDKKGLDENH